MSIERVGQFIEFVVSGEGGGTRTLARLNAIQLVSETDCVGNEVMITIANRTFRIDASLSELRVILAETESLTSRRHSGMRSRSDAPTSVREPRAK